MKMLISSRQEHLLFARNFLRHPKMLGSLIPSSTFLVRRLLRQIDWARAKVVVEYGPGVGTITREVLRRMHPDAVLIVFETNPEFVTFLRQTIPDERLRVVHGSAAGVMGWIEQGGERPDYVISGIPFSTLPEPTRREILQTTREVLQPDGALLVYQFSPKVLPSLRQTFSTVVRSFEPLNILPAQLFFCSP
ncbi:MAG: methyltransferase domain-containing protein [Desulfuromonadales bacterium]|nr:methyltransferase domain-containing protein [Desulfuromonadales bacterium]